MSQEIRTRLMTLGVLALIFALGVLVGVVADRTVVGSLVRFASAAPELSTPPAEEVTGGDASPASRSRWMIHQVDLSETQRVFVDSVIGYYRSEVRALSEAYDSAYWEAVQATRDALRGVLDPAQREYYDALLEARDRASGRDEAQTGS